MQARSVRFRNITRPTQFFFPDTIAFEMGRVIVTKRKWLGLGKWEDDIGIDRVASVEIHSGLLNATVVVQVQGRNDLDLSVKNLPKKQAEALVVGIRAAAR